MDKKLYTIKLIGCGDETYFAMSLSGKEVKLLKEMEKLSNENSYCRCMPTMKIVEEI